MWDCRYAASRKIRLWIHVKSSWIQSSCRSIKGNMSWTAGTPKSHDHLLSCQVVQTDNTQNHMTTGYVSKKTYFHVLSRQNLLSKQWEQKRLVNPKLLKIQVRRFWVTCDFLFRLGNISHRLGSLTVYSKREPPPWKLSGQNRELSLALRGRADHDVSRFFL